MERLQKVMAEAGVASRRHSEQIILEGRVTVNGKKVTTLGTKVDGNDVVAVDGVPLQKEQHEYFLLNKPRGVISSAHDEHGRKTVVDLLKKEGIDERIYPVGRLDYDTTGALLLTNDGDLANKLMHPRFEINKTYIAKVRGLVTNNDLRTLRRGVKIDGKMTRESHPRLVETNRAKKTCRVKITIHEGRYHQVKKMFEAIGHPVIKLHRESYGFLDLSGLASGEFRPLRTAEVRALREL